MKKVIFYSITAITVVLLASCGGGTTSGDKETSSAKETSTKKKTEGQIPIMADGLWSGWGGDIEPRSYLDIASKNVSFSFSDELIEAELEFKLREKCPYKIDGIDRIALFLYTDLDTEVQLKKGEDNVVITSRERVELRDFLSTKEAGSKITITFSIPMDEELKTLILSNAKSAEVAIDILSEEFDNLQ